MTWPKANSVAIFIYIFFYLFIEGRVAGAPLAYECSDLHKQLSLGPTDPQRMEWSEEGCHPLFEERSRSPGDCGCLALWITPKKAKRRGGLQEPMSLAMQSDTLCHLVPVIFDCSEFSGQLSQATCDPS